MTEWTELGLLAVALAHVFLNNFTKVEESFSLHAVQDIISRTPLELFDHVMHPGAVPRSFIGPLVLSIIVYPFLYLFSALNFLQSNAAVQTLVRSSLAALNVASILFLTRRVRASFGKTVMNYTLLLLSTQFHLFFWIGRTIPNSFAFPLVQVVYAMSIGPWPRRTQKGNGSIVEILEGFATLTMAALIMRLEILALLVPMALSSLVEGTTKLYELLLTGVVATVLSLALTTAVDSAMWGRTLWPEGSAILFNVVQGHSAEWGIQPWHYYFTNSLPRLFHFALPLIGLAMMVDRRVRSIGLPAFFFVGLLSFLGHKEWRFFIYIIPALNVCAAAGLQCMEVLFSKKAKRLALLALVGTNLLISVLGLLASHHNYPGGLAMTTFATLRNSPSQATIHIDSHAAMTGASKFLHPFSHDSPAYLNPSSTYPNNYVYDRNETMGDDAGEYEKFDWLITSRPLHHSILFKEARSFGEYRGLRRLGLRAIVKEKRLVRILVEPSVWIMQRRP